MSKLGYEELLSVERPGRYLGGEWNQTVKDGPVGCRLLFAFPDAYEIGMSHLGLRILYSLVNGQEDLAAERVFSPWADMEALMRERGEPLRSLETGREAAQFDLIGFSLQHELNFTNILALIDLAGLPLRSADRDDDAPLLLAGGPVAFNPEPLAPFIDLFLIGDAEEQLPRMMRRLAELKRGGAGKREILAALSSLDGIYAPALYETITNPASGLKIVSPPHGEMPFIRKATIEDLDRHPFPSAIPVPFCDIVHDRAAIELARGCSRGCRFCQAGVIYLPERQRKPQEVADTILTMLAATGYGDVGLSSLTPNDYHGLRELVAGLHGRLGEEGVSLSLASLSPAGIDRGLLELIAGVRKTGLTIAPEAGTQRLRDAINKGICEEEIFDAARVAFELGWRLIKLYFMIGLPTETDDDVAGIAELSKAVSWLKNGVNVTSSVSNFVPKPHTPFQWLPMATREEFSEKQRAILHGVRRNKRIGIKFHNIETSLLEGVLARGDRDVADAIEAAFRSGCRFDGWRDKLQLDLWRRAFDESGIDPDFYIHRELPAESLLPWSHVDCGVKTGFLRAELEAALRSQPRLRCSQRNCPECGACPPSLLRERWAGKHEAMLLDLGSSAKKSGEQKRWRLRYAKTGVLRLLGHLDLLRLIARIFRRAGIETEMSKGFHPQPRFSFGPALPLGMEGRNEYFEAILLTNLQPDDLLIKLNEACPGDLVFSAAEVIPDGEPTLATAIAAARYRIRFRAGGSFGAQAAEDFMRRESLAWVRKRDGKPDQRFDIRRSVLNMEIEEDGRELLLELGLGKGFEGPQARPSEVASAAFSLDFNEIEVIREHLLMQRDGLISLPLES